MPADKKPVVVFIIRNGKGVRQIYPGGLPDTKYPVSVYQADPDTSRILMLEHAMRGTAAAVRDISDILDVIRFHRYSRKTVSVPAGNRSVYQTSAVRVPSSPFLGSDIPGDIAGTYLNFTRGPAKDLDRVAYSKYLDARHFLARGLEKLGYRVPETPGDYLFYDLIRHGISVADVSVREADHEADHEADLEADREAGSLNDMLLEFNRVYRGEAKGFPA